MTPSDEVVLDFHRPDRIGLEEAVLCGTKNRAQLEHILGRARERGSSILLTRLPQEHFDALSEADRAALDYDPVSRTAYFGARHPMREGATQVAIVSAGTSDASVAREAQRTLTYMGEPTTFVADVGVAGLHRLTSRLDELKAHAVLIVVAGMDAALPTVLGGLVPGVIVGVPTSVGYGVATGGTTALHSMLASCAPGIAVVNIDNGYGAACAAMRVVRALAR